MDFVEGRQEKSVQRNKRSQQSGDNGQHRKEGPLGQHLLFPPIKTLTEPLFRQVKPLVQ